MIWLHGRWYTFDSVRSSLGDNDGVVLAGTCDIIACVAQCQFAPHSFLAFGERVQFDAHGFEDQTVAVRWARGNFDTLQA